MDHDFAEVGIDDEDDNIEDIHLTFKVSSATYAVCVTHVTEIVCIQDINHLPGMPDGFCGVINLRGHVVPVLDMQARFGGPSLDTNDRTVIVVLEVDGERAGLMVEEVTEVVDFPSDSIESATSSVGRERSKNTLVSGIAKRGDRMCMILDVRKMLNDSVPTPPEEADVDATQIALEAAEV